MDAWRDHITTYGGIGLIAGLVLVLLIVPLLPRGERKKVKLPAVLLGVHVGVLALRTLVSDDVATQKALYLTSVFFLLASIARSTHLFLLHSLLNRMSSGPLPRIVGDLIQAIFFLMAVLVTMSAAGVELGSILTTSALLTAVIGLSLQDTLGNLFAGLAIQLQQPFRVGDWIQWDEDELNIGRVTEMNWRAVTVVTLEHVEITVPNSTLAKSGLSNFSAPAKEARRQVVVWAPPDRSPREIQRALILSLDGVKGVLSSPRPSIVTLDFTERGVAYGLRYFIRDFERREIIAGEVRDRVWYALDRLGVPIPAPVRTVHLHEVTEESLEHEKELQVEHLEDELRAVGFLDVLPSESLHRLAEKVEERRYAPGERIIREGDEGEELFIVRQGRVRVEVGGRRRKEVARLTKGQFFGEMSLMTGAERRASVSAVDEVVVLVIGKSALQPVLAEAPELAELVSEALADRQLELEEADSRDTLTELPAEQSGVLLQRIKRFFSLGHNDD